MMRYGLINVIMQMTLSDWAVIIGLAWYVGLVHIIYKWKYREYSE